MLNLFFLRTRTQALITGYNKIVDMDNIRNQLFKNGCTIKRQTDHDKYAHSQPNNRLLFPMDGYYKM